jgi:hypothetical protein
MQLLTKNEETLLELLELMSSCLWLQKWRFPKEMADVSRLPQTSSLRS